MTSKEIEDIVTKKDFRSAVFITERKIEFVIYSKRCPITGSPRYSASILMFGDYQDFSIDIAVGLALKEGTKYIKML